MRGAAERAGCRVAGRLTARCVAETRVRAAHRRRGLAAGRLRVERTVGRKAETSRLLMQLPMVTVQRGRIKAVRWWVAGDIRTWRRVIEFESGAVVHIVDARWTVQAIGWKYCTGPTGVVWTNVHRHVNSAFENLYFTCKAFNVLWKSFVVNHCSGLKCRILQLIMIITATLAYIRSTTCRCQNDAMSCSDWSTTNTLLTSCPLVHFTPLTGLP